MDDCTAGSWLMASWPLLMSSLEPPTCPWNIHVRHQRPESPLHMLPLQLWLPLILFFFLVLSYFWFACYQPSDFLSHVCPHIILGCDPGQQSPGHRPVFLGQVSLLLHLALGASGRIMQIPTVFVLVLGPSTPALSFRLIWSQEQEGALSVQTSLVQVKIHLEICLLWKVFSVIPNCLNRTMEYPATTKCYSVQGRLWCMVAMISASGVDEWGANVEGWVLKS